jgi:signal transduction histidine kinase
MNRIVTDFLTFGEPGRPAPRLFDVRELAAGALALAQAEALPAPGVRIEAPSGAAPILAHADRDHAMQILLNVVRNAFEATPPSGSVSLRARSRAGAVEIEVADTGAGIPADVAARLFRPFGSTKRGGTGLGLAVAQRLARRNGGDLRIASGPGGTTATVEFPAPPADLDLRHGDA